MGIFPWGVVGGGLAVVWGDGGAFLLRWCFLLLHDVREEVIIREAEGDRVVGLAAGRPVDSSVKVTLRTATGACVCVCVCVCMCVSIYVERRETM